MFAEAASVDDGNDKKLDRAGFVALYKMIDDLFVYDDDDEENDVVTEQISKHEKESTKKSSLPNKQEALLSFLDDLQTMSRSAEDRIPCGMRCTDKEREIVAKMVAELETGSDTPNLVVQNNGKVEAADLVGVWDLLYTSSKAMINNKSLMVFDKY
ncbi:MAG: hypothetical protein SGARI_004854 [Bacillariaceae sp.]